MVYFIDPVKRTKAPLFDNVHLAQVMSLAGDVTDMAKVVKPDTPTWAVLSPDKKGTRTIRIRGRRSPAGEMRSCADWIGYYN